MDFTSGAWLWMYVGAALMLLELMAPGFVVFFFGLSAATVGMLHFALGDVFTGTWQMIAFSAFSIFYLAVLRRWLKSVFGGTKTTSQADFEFDFVGRTGVVTTAVRPPLAGRVLIGDAEWTAQSDSALEQGAQVKVVEQHNLTMKVEAI